jgi:MinD-like ATPase involved in chromosome partitioning or flagellar assembly
MNRYDKRITILPEKVAESLKQEMVAILPFDDRVVVPSVNRGVPFMLADRNQLIAKSILKLAEVVRQRVAEMVGESAEAPSTKR